MNLDYWIMRAMQTQGGSFVSALGTAYGVADSTNKRILRDAFPACFLKYQIIAEKLKQEDDAKP